MAITHDQVNIGAAPNDGTGDPARTAFQKLNDMIAALIAASNSYETGKVDSNGGSLQNATTDTPPVADDSLRVANTAWTQTELSTLASAISAALDGKVNDSGDQVTGPLILKDGSGEGSVVITPSSDANPGKVEFFSGDGSRRLLIGYEATASVINFLIESGWTMRFGGTGAIDFATTPTFATQSQGDNSQKPATTSYVDTAVAGAGNAIGSTIFYDGLDASLPNALEQNGASYSAATYAALFAKIVKTATVTVTIATPGVVTWTGHGLKVGYPIKFKTTGALPTGLVAGTTYWIISAGFTANTFQLSATPGGTAINTTGSQSGVHTAACAPHGIANDFLSFNVPDMRSAFIRGFDDGRGIDTGRGHGQEQLDAMESHTHSYQMAAAGGILADTAGGTGSFYYQQTGATSGGSSGRTATETRPRNNTKRLFIKYQ